MELLLRFAICCAGLAVPAAAQAEWYITAETGIGRHSSTDQVGWNADTVCYPTDACFAIDPVPSVPGYRWRYMIDAGAGAGFAIALGREFPGFRIELSAAHSRNDLEQVFVDIEYLNGSERTTRDGSIVADVNTSIGALTTRVASLDVYRDLAAPGARIIPYVGIGLGVAFAKIQDVHFSADYRDTSPVPPAYDPPLSFYGSNQDVDHSDVVAAGHFHAGADYVAGPKTRIGAKLTCSVFEGTADDGVYSRHPMHAQDPGFSNRNTFDRSRNCSMAVTLRRRLDR
ncbi:MAG: hypothetical protein OXI90_14015 [Gammaproteobacteria bacterium]|nr:hypothetical protein [Gammaproteobacteria bacterium]